ncbi:MAG: hypothetical protein R2712_19370 [Vicinamibacterales bacterium]
MNIAGTGAGGLDAAHRAAATSVQCVILARRPARKDLLRKVFDGRQHMSMGHVAVGGS